MQQIYAMDQRVLVPVYPGDGGPCEVWDVEMWLRLRGVAPPTGPMIVRHAFPIRVASLAGETILHVDVNALISPRPFPIAMEDIDPFLCRFTDALDREYEPVSRDRIDSEPE